jgi:hypothetical protein
LYFVFKLSLNDLRQKMNPSDKENEKETDAAITPRCCLCGSDCRYDDRVVHRFVGYVNLIIGWFLWPMLACLLGSVLGAYTTPMGVMLGLIVWFGTFLMLIWTSDRWVCSRCGAIFPSAGKTNGSNGL